MVSEAILEQTESIAYLTVSQNIADINQSLQGYIDDGDAVEGETIEALANELDMDARTLETTIQSYNEAVETGNDADQGRESEQCLGRRSLLCYSSHSSDSPYHGWFNHQYRIRSPHS